DDRALGDLRDLARFRRGDGEALTPVDWQHHRNVRLSIADVYHLIARHHVPRADLLDSGDLAVARRHAEEGADLALAFLELEASPHDMIRRHDPLERREHDVFRGGRDHVEIETVSVYALREHPGEIGS